MQIYINNIEYLCEKDRKGWKNWWNSYLNI